jgi:hypothetical protein
MLNHFERRRRVFQLLAFVVADFNSHEPQAAGQSSANAIQLYSKTSRFRGILIQFQFEVNVSDDHDESAFTRVLQDYLEVNDCRR